MFAFAAIFVTDINEEWSICFQSAILKETVKTREFFGLLEVSDRRLPCRVSIFA